MNSIAYEDNSIRSVRDPFPGIADDNPMTLSVETYWQDNPQFEPNFPLSKSSWPDGINASAPRISDVWYMRDRGWNEYRLADCAKIQSGAISVNILWPSEDRLDIQFDPVIWRISTTSRQYNKSNTSEPKKINIQKDQSIRLQYRYVINIDTDANANTNHLVFVKLVLHEVVWRGDIYRETGKHAYDVSCKIDATQMPAYV